MTKRVEQNEEQISQLNLLLRRDLTQQNKLLSNIYEISQLKEINFKKNLNEIETDIIHY